MSDTVSPKPADQPGSERSDGEAPPAKKMGKLPLVILTVVVIGLLIAGVWSYLANRDLVSTDDAQVDGDAVTMEAKVSGYVTELDVTDNQRVKAGQLLFRIDPRDYIATRDQQKGALAQAEAQVANAKANLDAVRVTGPAKLVAAKAQVVSTTATRDYAVSDFARQTSVDHRSTSQQSIDQAFENLRTAKANLANNQAQATEADVVPQTIEQAKAQLATAELNLGYTEVRAPEDGWITQRNIQRGSYVTAGQSAFSLVAPTFWVTANFKENQLKRVRLGQKVKIKIDAYPKLRIEGHINSLQMGTGSRFSAFPAENATGNFVKIVQRVPVKIVIDRGLDPDHPLPLGLSVAPTVNVR